jgi:hypothetical protein
MVFTVQVACTPFHQGILAVSYQYSNDAEPATANYKRCKYSATATNLPHVRLDLSETTMVQLKVPYLDGWEYTPVTNYATLNTQLGTFAINTILPVETPPGGTAPTYKVLIHLEDLELHGVAPDTVETVVLESGGSLKKEFETDAFPFSSSVYALSRAVGWVGKGVPTIKAITGPLSWFLEKSSGAVRAFGFSKPQILSPMVRVVRGETAGECNTDVASATVVVGPRADNCLAVSPMLGGTEVDEMSLKFLTSQWSQICTFKITDTTASGALLYAVNMNPWNMWYRNRLNYPLPAANILVPAYCLPESNSFIPSSLLFTASPFRAWSGGFKFRFTFAKTKFHGGRVMACFTPRYGFRDEATVPALAGGYRQPFGLTKMFDLRDSSVFEFEVPYTYVVPWINNQVSYGTVSLSIVDPLMVSGAVAKQISCMVEVCGADDFKLAIPGSPIWPAHVLGTPRFESGGNVMYKPEMEMYTMGESIQSVKQLIMMPHREVPVYAPPNGTEQCVIPNWFYTPRYSPLTPTPATGKRHAFSCGGYFASAYVYACGGTDIHAYTSYNGDSAVGHVSSSKILLTQCPANEGYTTFPADDWKVCRATSNAPYLVSNNTGVLHARLPAYQLLVHQTTFAGDAYDWTGSADNFVKSSAGVSYRLILQNTGEVAVNCTFFMSAAEDGRLAHYIGPPPLLLPTEGTSMRDIDSIDYP